MISDKITIIDIIIRYGTLTEKQYELKHMQRPMISDRFLEYQFYS